MLAGKTTLTKNLGFRNKWKSEEKQSVEEGWNGLRGGCENSYSVEEREKKMRGRKRERRQTGS